MKRWTWAMLMVLLAGMIALLAAWQVSRQPPGAAYLTLSTGQTVRFRGAAVGTNLVEPGFLPFQQHLPAPVVEWMGRIFGVPPGRLLVSTSAEPKLVVWLEVRNPPGAAAGMMPYKSLWLTEADGGKVGGGLRGQEREVFLNPGQRTVPVDFSIFPRRPGILGLAVGDRSSGNGWLPEGTLMFRNPAVSPAERWEGERLPAVRREGGLECALLSFSLSTLESRASGRVRDAMGGSPETRIPRDWDVVRGVAEMRFRTTDGSSNFWVYAGLGWSDATGNRGRPASGSISSWVKNGVCVRHEWSPIPWDGEAWELRVEAKRGPGAEVGPGERWVMEGVELPALDGTNRVDRITEAGSVRLRLLEVVRKPSVDDPSAGWSSRTVSRIVFTVEGLTNGLYADLVRVTDEDGREHSSRSTSTSSSEGTSGLEVTHAFPSLGATGGRLKLEWLVQPSRAFTFRFSPKSGEVLGQPLSR